MPPVIRLSVLLMMVGCYQSASVLTSDDILSIRVDNPEGITANGENYVDIVVSMDERTASDIPVTLTTSSGILNYNVDENSPMAQQTVVFNDSTGEVNVKMRVGLQPGDVFLTAQADVDGAGFLAQQTVNLLVSPPQNVEVTPAVFNVPADGTQDVRVDASVYGPPLSDAQLTTKVSLGTSYAVGVCCGSPEALQACEGQASLRAPSLVVLDNGQSFVFNVLTRRVEVEPYTGFGALEGTEEDLDGDGSPKDVDCDDTNPNIFPGAPEICDGFENACIPGAPVDDAFKDTDLDGLKDCVDLEIDQYLVVQYVENSTDSVVCDQLDQTSAYGMAHMVLEAMAIQ